VVKKVWTPAMRAAFAAKMKRARALAKGKRTKARRFDHARAPSGLSSSEKMRWHRKRRKNPTKAEVKAAAAKIAKAAGKLAWRGAKLTGRVGKASAKAAAAEVKASICRPRAKNPKRKKVWTAAARAAFALRMKRARNAAKRFDNRGNFTITNFPKRRRARVHKRRRISNPFRVVIKAVPKGEYRKRSRNPTSPLYYDGKNFTSNKAKRRTFSSVQPAEVVARHLLHRFPILRKGYVVTLNSV
jgi:hypothetical protein